MSNTVVTVMPLTDERSNCLPVAPLSVILLPIERLSIELTHRCGKKCSFCYNHSHPVGDTVWTADDVVTFVEDCANHGTKAVSFGGGEPLEYPAVFEVLKRLQGKVFRSLTSNGLLLNGKMFEALVDAQPDKVHLSIHFPDRPSEVDRVIRQVHTLAAAGIRSGVNLPDFSRYLF